VSAAGTGADSPAVALHFAIGSDVGLHREGNEDAGYASSRLLVVADGMGGHAAGEVASATVIASLQALDADSDDPDLLGRLRTSIRDANQHLREMIAADDTLDGMGTTVTALLAAGNRLGMAHVGDSRAYLLRDGVLTQLTHDHTYVQQLVDDGRIRADEAERHPQRSLITRAVDGRESVEPDLVVHEARIGDRYLVCSDGLSGVVHEPAMAGALGEGTPEDAVRRLIDLALDGGAPDNVTCIVAEVVPAGTEPAVAGPLVAGAAGAGDIRPISRASAAPGEETTGKPAAAAAVADTSNEGNRADRRRTRRRRGLIIGITTAVLVAVGAALGWAYVQSQYYVGVDERNVAIYRGVEGSLAGISLSSVHTRATLAVDDLPSFEQEKVRDGIGADSLADARTILSRLEAEASPSPTPTPSCVVPLKTNPAPVHLSPSQPKASATRSATRTPTAPAQVPTPTCAPGQAVPSPSVTK
jgi:protein phosphatase